MRNDLADLALKAVVRVMGERELCTFHHRGQTAAAQGVYQASHVDLDPETGVQVRSTQPVLLINGSDLPWRLQQGDEVNVRGATFMVRDAQPDGHNGVLVMLHRTTNR